MKKKEIDLDFEIWSAYGKHLDAKRAKLFALVEKLQTESYEGLYDQLNDAELIGRLATEMKSLMTMRNQITSK